MAILLTLGSLSGSRLLAASDSTYGQIPLTFTANRGQVHDSVRFTAKGCGLTAYFTPAEVVINLLSTTVRMRYLGANVSPAVEGLDLQDGHANYFLGADPSLWRTNVPLYGRIVYKDLYPGIDMLYSSHARLLKSEFIVAPGADPSAIRIAYTGAESVRIDEDGSLVLTTADGELREQDPEIYQDGSDGREPVEGAFRVSGDVVTFSVGQYDRSRPLRIDPTLYYSTYLGGGGTDRSNAIAVDSAGAAYVTGYTDSTNFPVTAGVVKPASGGSVDAFVTKLNAAGNAIVYSTYLGGAGDDRGFSIAVDGSGNAYVTGYTGSSNFPLAGPLQSTFGGSKDAFVTKLNSTGTALVYSTYLGGSADDRGNGIAIDTAGSAYITGSTASSNFPLSGPFQAALGGQQDGFVAKLNSTGSALVYSTYLGGSADDRGSSIAVDSAGSAYIAGNTGSTNFPTASPLQAANQGATDAFVTKLSVSGASLIYSTYLGGSGVENIELGGSIAVDSAGSAYITGATSSTNFPVFAPLQTASNGGLYDAFVVKLTPAGTAFVYSTYLGGSSIDFGQSIAVGSGGIAFITGYTSSLDFPTVSADQPANGGSFDVFVAKLNASGSALVESGFLGGGDSDTGFGIAIDSFGSAYVTGQTLSSNFPLRGPVQSSNGGNLSAFVAKFTFGSVLPPTAVSVTPSSGTGTSQTFALVYSDPIGFTNISWVEVNWNTTQLTAGGCYLHYDRATNVLQLSADNGSGWAGSATLGVAGALQNSQCTVNTISSSVSGSGNNFTLNLALTFYPAFAGSKNIYMQVQNFSAGLLAPWQSKGTWTVPSVLPSSVSVTPASGSGITQTFSFAYTDPYGYADIKYANILFQTSLVAQNSCFLQYTPATNTLTLVNDSGSGYLGSTTLGAAIQLANNQCSVNAATSSATVSGNNLTVTLALTFTALFAGAKSVFMGPANNANAFTGWQTMGTWTVPPGGTVPATSVSVTPASGSGAVQTFSFVYSHAYGYANISSVNILFNTQIAAPSSCFVQYTRATNTLVLVLDSGSGYVGSALVGTTGTLSNSQCTVDAGASSVSSSGNNLTVNVAVIFKPAFAGAKNVYMAAYNNVGFYSGWLAKGAWTALGSGPPTNVSVSPASGTGATQLFSFLYSDPAGSANINYVDILFNTQLAAPSSCFVQYTRATNSLTLVLDSGDGYVGFAQLGSPGTLSNSQCTLDAGASTVSAAGNNLTVNLALTFKPAFTGAKNTYMGVVNNLNVFSGWEVKGAWTASGSLPPASVSVTPASGTGATQSLSFVYSDAPDINFVGILFNTIIAAPSTCFVQYTRATNILVLVQDSGSGYVGSALLGGPGTLSNSQCSLDSSLSTVSVAGSSLTLTLALTFKPAFTGAKNVYMSVSNNANAFSGWLVKGTWTVSGSLPPATVSVTPASGSGATQAFTFVYSDATDINFVGILFNTVIAAPNTCFLQYTRSTNTLVLVQDTGSGYVGSAVLGSPGTLTNSQCTLNAGTSTVSSAGGNLTLTLALTFKPAFTGAKNVYMSVANNASLFSGWTLKGVWTVP
jgi:hypothetical protein